MGKLICCIVKLNRICNGCVEFVFTDKLLQYEKRFEIETVYRFHYCSKDIL